MGIFSKDIDTLQELLVAEIKDLYDAEQQLVSALPKMAKAATSPQLKTAFKDHLKETKAQVERLESVFSLLEEEPERETCKAMKGLISEGEEIVNADGHEAVIDAALIAAAQRVEHYEIAGYGAARTFAQQLGHREVAELLQQTLNEEGQADKKLTDIAAKEVNQSAARAA